MQVNEFAGAIYSSQSNSQSNHWVSGVCARNLSRVRTKMLFRIVKLIHSDFTFVSWIQKRKLESKFGQYQEGINHFESFRREKTWRKDSVSDRNYLSVTINEHFLVAFSADASRIPASCSWTAIWSTKKRRARPTLKFPTSRTLRGCCSWRRSTSSRFATTLSASNPMSSSRKRECPIWRSIFWWRPASPPSGVFGRPITTGSLGMWGNPSFSDHELTNPITLEV